MFIPLVAVGFVLGVLVTVAYYETKKAGGDDVG